MTLLLHEFHQCLGARFESLNGVEVVADYGDRMAEYSALREAAAVLDLSFRGRLCVTGADRARFLHGQVTNDVKKLRTGEGCRAALVTAKGKMVSDLNIFCLSDELLLDFEPGLARTVTERLEKYIVADDAQVVDAAPHYGLLSVQGPKAEAVVRDIGLFAEIPGAAFGSTKISDATLGEIYLMNHARPAGGFDLFVPTNALGVAADKLIASAKSFGGRASGWGAWETARVEAGFPRFGADMDETNIPLECGPAMRDAISFNKGCYIGQEIINRIHSIGHVNRELVSLRLADDSKTLPGRGDKIFKAGKEVGHITSAAASPRFGARVALGYVRREAVAAGTELKVRTSDNESPVSVSTVQSR